uniref:Target of rapamycin complex subunit lst8 n=1 Tax=Globodera rostochiensis TaxID=31243 RepID=A0A914HED3_GLORO
MGMMRPMLVSASMDATIRIWDVASQKQLEALPYKESQVNNICITPDGAQLLVGAWQNLRFYDLQCPTPQGLHTFSVHEKNVTSVGFQVDGAWMYTGGEDCMAKIWDMRINQLNCQRIFQVNTPVHSVVLHPNQVELIVADSTGAIYLWDLRSDRDDSLLTEVDMSEFVAHVDIDPVGRQCAAVTNRGNLFLWDVSHTGMMQPNGPPFHLQQPHQQQQFVDQQRQGDKENGGEQLTEEQSVLLPPLAPPPTADLNLFQFPTNQQQQHHHRDGAENRQPPRHVHQQPMHLPPPQLPHVMHHRQLHAATQQPIPPHHPLQPVVMPQQPSAAVAATAPPPLAQVQPVRPSPPPPLSLINSANKYTKVRAHQTFALKCRFRPDGLAVATTSADQSAKLWSCNTHKLLNSYSVPGNKWVWDCAFTNDSNFMVTASSDGILRMWELASCSVVRTYQGHSMGITAMAFRDCR